MKNRGVQARRAFEKVVKEIHEESVNEAKDAEPSNVAERETRSTLSAARFSLTYRGQYGYGVSIPNYEGGEVVKAEMFDALYAALKAIQTLGHDCVDLHNMPTGKDCAACVAERALALVGKASHSQP